MRPGLFVIACQCSGVAPNRLRRLNYQTQLGALGLYRYVVAMHRAAEAALG